MDETKRSATGGEPRPMRADARRNYEQLLGAAQSVFAERGTNASLEDVARRAGVGIGTLYRHFPTREALLDGVLRSRLEALVAEAGQLLESPDAGEAFASWVAALVSYMQTYRGLAGAVAPAFCTTSGLSPSCQEMARCGAALLARAQAAGAIRPDADPGDVITLVGAVVWTAEQAPDDSGRAGRLLSVVLDGLRPERPSAE
jgi:AcrR family transcriptional regulator